MSGLVWLVIGLLFLGGLLIGYLIAELLNKNRYRNSRTHAKQMEDAWRIAKGGKF